MVVVDGKGGRSASGVRVKEGIRAFGPGLAAHALPQPSSAANARGSVIHPAFYLLSRTAGAAQADPAHSFTVMRAVARTSVS